MTEAQVGVINAEISKAKEAAGNAAKLSDLTQAQKQKVAESLTVAGNEIGVKVNFDSSANKLTAVDSKTGAVVFEAKGNIIATTGIDMTGTYIIVGLLSVLLLTAAGFVYREIKINKGSAGVR